MKQVQIWIEECPFDRTIIFATEYTHWEDVVEINRIIEERSWRFDPECDFLKLKSNESRNTIIEALEKYQESLLPNGYDMDDYKKDKNTMIWMSDVEAAINIHGDYRRFNFYDPETRVITITDFKEELCT